MSHSGKYQGLEFEYIETVEHLEQFCKPLEGAPYIALDTEFLRESTYYPQLCMVQIKYEQHLACIDALAVKDLSALFKLLYNDNITKIFHAASQDMEIFVMLKKQAPSPVFDTQVAAPLLGYQEQIGYANLVKEVLNVNLPKTHTRADWSRRPVPDKQLHYALDDVIHLESLYQDLHKRLEKRGRLEWLKPEFEEISQMERYNKPARHLWQKLRAGQSLKGRQLATLQALVEWREIYARETNRPKNWVLKDDAITDLAKQLPASVEELGHLRSVGSRTREKLGAKLVDIIADAEHREPASLPEFVKKKKPNANDNTTADALTAVVSVLSRQHDIHATLLATRKQLLECVAAGDSTPLAGWRKAILGDAIDEFLSGRLTLNFRDGEVQLDAAS